MNVVTQPVVEITEAVWHRDRSAAGVMAWRNDMAGETFTLPTVGTYVRINDRHVRIEAEHALTHAEACALASHAINARPERVWEEPEAIR